LFCDEPRWICFEKSFKHVFELPLLRNAQKRDQKNLFKKTEEKKTYFFVMSPGGFVSWKTIIMFLNSPCYETPKNAIQKNRLKKKLNRTTFFGGLRLRQMHVTSIILFRAPPPLVTEDNGQWAMGRFAN
jgi:hypothetical protein